MGEASRTVTRLFTLAAVPLVGLHAEIRESVAVVVGRDETALNQCEERERFPRSNSVFDGVPSVKKARRLFEAAIFCQPRLSLCERGVRWTQARGDELVTKAD